MNEWQPLMPHLFFYWILDAVFLTVCVALIIASAIQADWFYLTIGIALLGTLVAQARRAALRIRRGAES